MVDIYTKVKDLEHQVNVTRALIPGIAEINIMVYFKTNTLVLLKNYTYIHKYSQIYHKYSKYIELQYHSIEKFMIVS